MKHLYKTSPKDFIKQHYKTIGDILIWLGLMVCIILCAIYYTRVNLNLDTGNNYPKVQEIRRDKPLSNRVYDNKEGYTYYYLKSESYLQQEFDLNNSNILDYVDGHFHTQTFSEQVYYYAQYNGTFYFKDIDRTKEYKTIDIKLKYDAENNFIIINYVYLIDLDNNWLTIYSRSNGGQYNPRNILVDEFTFDSPTSDFEETYHGSILDLVFDKVFVYNDSSIYKLDFSQNPNFNQLLTYYRVGIYDFTYTGNPSGSWYTLPLTFVYNEVLYESIMFNTIYVVNYLADSQTIKNYTDITGESTQYLMSCSSVYFVKYGGTTHVQSDTSGNVMRPPTLVGDCLQVAYREVAYYTQDNNFSGGSTSIYPVWNMYKGWNTYNRVSYDLYISNSSLKTTPYPNNDSTSAHFPLNNLTNKEILELISTDLGRVYGGSITGDVGLGQVFTLYKDAFGSLVGLMAIQVIPGITLGLLLFLPLVGTIIIVIIRLVKK